MDRAHEFALELFEYKVADLLARREVRGGVESVWALHAVLSDSIDRLTPEERSRFLDSERDLRTSSGAPGRSSARPVLDFDDLVIGDDPDPVEVFAPDPVGATRGAQAAPAAPPSPVSSEGRAEQLALRRLAASVWRHDQQAFMVRLAAGLRAERDRYTARLLYALHRNLSLHLQSDAAWRDSSLERFRVREAIPGQDDPLFSATDMDALTQLVRDTFECVQELAQRTGPYARLAVRPGSEFDLLLSAALTVARDPYAGKPGLLVQPGPSARQLRVAIEELAKEVMRPEERQAQRRRLEERLQRVLAFERHQRKLFSADVERFEALVTAFFERLRRYLPKRVGGEAGPPILPGRVLFGLDPLLATESLPPGSSSVTLRLKGPTRVQLASLDVSLAASAAGLTLYVGGQAREVEGKVLSLEVNGRLLHVFREGDYVHLRAQEEPRSVAASVAEAALVVKVVASPLRVELLEVLSALGSSPLGEPSEVVRRAIAGIAGLVSRAPDRRVAIEGFLRGAARAAQQVLPGSVYATIAAAIELALDAEGLELDTVLERSGLEHASVHTLTSEPLALEIATFSVTIRSYPTGSSAVSDSLVVMLPGMPLGTFDEYLVEPLGSGHLVCVKGEQELVVAHVPLSPSGPAPYEPPGPTGSAGSSGPSGSTPLAGSSGTSGSLASSAPGASSSASPAGSLGDSGSPAGSPPDSGSAADSSAAGAASGSVNT